MVILAVTSTGVIVGYWQCIKPADAPPHGHHLGYPDPVGIWEWREGAPPLSVLKELYNADKN